MVSVSLDTTASWPLMPQTQQMNRGATGARLGTTARGGLPALSHVKWAPTSQMWVSWSTVNPVLLAAATNTVVCSRNEDENAKVGVRL